MELLLSAWAGCKDPRFHPKDQGLFKDEVSMSGILRLGTLQGLSEKILYAVTVWVACLLFKKLYILIVWETSHVAV